MRRCSSRGLNLGRGDTASRPSLSRARSIVGGNVGVPGRDRGERSRGRHRRGGARVGDRGGRTHNRRARERLDKPFPPANVALFGRIAREHLAISQFAPGVPPRKENFPQRNRTMALLSDATIIVEAGEGSGTLHQGWEALRLGRALFLLESLAVSDELTWPSGNVEVRRAGAHQGRRRRRARVDSNPGAR